MQPDLPKLIFKRTRKAGRLHNATDIKRALKEIVVGQGITANSPLPPERDISTLFKVSRNTARKALLELANENIIYRIHGKGTFVSGIPPHQSNRSALTIGILLPDLDMEGDINETKMPTHFKKIEAIESMAAERGYALISLGRKPETKSLLTEWKELPVDGILVLATAGDREFAEKIQLLNKPMVYVASSAVSTQINMVAFDQRQTGYRVTRLLLQSGRRRILWGLPKTGNASCDPRLDGYRQALAEWNLPVLPSAYAGDPESLAAADIARDICRKADAVITDDYHARTLLEKAIRAGINIPADLAVFGYFNRDFCQTTRPALSSVNLPHARQGRAALDLLAKIIADPRRPVEQKLVETELVIRSSSG